MGLEPVTAGATIGLPGLTDRNSSAQDSGDVALALVHPGFVASGVDRPRPRLRTGLDSTEVDMDGSDVRHAWLPGFRHA